MNEDTTSAEAEAPVSDAPEAEVEAAPEAAKPKMKKKVSGIAATAALKVIATENKKRGASALRFQAYLDKKPDTVQKALDAGLTMGDIAYDVIHGSIEVEGAVVEEYEPKARGTSVAPEAGDEAGDAGSGEVKVEAEAEDEDDGGEMF